MIELNQNRLIISFPEIHPKARCTIEFQRTLRIPDDNQEYPLPPGLGQFPLDHVDNLGSKLPTSWKQHGGIFFPMYQAEAMWIHFRTNYPFAIKVAAGKINAVTGDTWSNELSFEPQDYLVLPGQPWLDGFCVSKGTIRQFVAMPLGDGYTAEEQLSGEAEHGGIQIIAYPMTREAYKEHVERAEENYLDIPAFLRQSVEEAAPDMGLAPGGLMRQEIYEDEYGVDAWATGTRARCYVHITNTQTYHRLTSKRPPTRPATAKDYSQAGLPWYEYYAGDAQALPGSGKLAGLTSLANKWLHKNKKVLPDNNPVSPTHIKQLNPNEVREGDF